MRIDADAVAVAGSSAGGLCTYLCAMHLSPEPRALLSIYGQAGECLVKFFRYPIENRISILPSAERQLPEAEGKTVYHWQAAGRPVRFHRFHLPPICFFTGHHGFSGGVLRTDGPSSKQTNVPFSTILPAR